MIIGYARSSGNDKYLKEQNKILDTLQCDKKYSDISSNTMGVGLEFDKAIASLKSGDTLVVSRICRVGKTYKRFFEFVSYLQARNIFFLSVSNKIDTSKNSNLDFFSLISALKDMEKELIAERTNIGLRTARARGENGGRPLKMTESVIIKAKSELSKGAHPKNVAKSIGVSVATLYRHIPCAEQMRLLNK